MKRSTKILGSSTGFLAMAAFAGMVSGASSRASASTVPGFSHSAKAGVKARTLDGPATQHDCKGKNDCKGVGGCNTGDNGCKGKNDCKGKGGCKTNGSVLL
jgi:hypothetical protein